MGFTRHDGDGRGLGKPDFFRLRMTRWWLVVVGVMACVAAVLLVGTLPRSSARPSARIVGGSMEPTLKGPQRGGWCPNCSMVSWFAEESLAPSPDGQCPRCGLGFLLDRKRPGEQLAVEILDSADELARHDIVIVSDPEVGKAEIKRLVALPGEALEIRDGDLWVDGQQIQKNLDQFMRQAIIVDRWQAIEGKLAQPAGPPDILRQGEGWCRYRSLSRWPVIEGKVERHPSPILDEYPTNASESRSLVPVTDLGMVIEILPPEGAVDLQVALWHPHPRLGGQAPGSPDALLHGDSPHHVPLGGQAPGSPDALLHGDSPHHVHGDSPQPSPRIVVLLGDSPHGDQEGVGDRPRERTDGDRPRGVGDRPSAMASEGGWTVKPEEQASQEALVGGKGGRREPPETYRLSIRLLPDRDRAGMQANEKSAAAAGGPTGDRSTGRLEAAERWWLVVARVDGRWLVGMGPAGGPMREGEKAGTNETTSDQGKPWRETRLLISDPQPPTGEAQEWSEGMELTGEGCTAELPLAWRVMAGELQVVRGWVVRDIHYRGPAGEAAWYFPKTAGYRVLGDNVSNSYDSRQRWGEGIPRSWIQGRAALLPAVADRFAHFGN